MKRAAVRKIEAALFDASIVVRGGRNVRRAPRVAKQKRREAPIEASCVALAKERGWTSRKMNGLGFAAWPDRLFLPPEQKPARIGQRKPPSLLPAPIRFWVEFKRPGEEPTPRQSEMHRELRARGEIVYCLDDREQFRKTLLLHEGGL